MSLIFNFHFIYIVNFIPDYFSFFNEFSTLQLCSFIANLIKLVKCIFHLSFGWLTSGHNHSSKLRESILIDSSTELSYHYHQIEDNQDNKIIKHQVKKLIKYLQRHEGQIIVQKSKIPLYWKNYKFSTKKLWLHGWLWWWIRLRGRD